MGILDDLFAPIGPNAQGRQAQAEEEKRKALAAILNSPTATKYAGRPDAPIPSNGGGIRSKLMTGIGAGADAYNMVKDDQAPQPQSVDPTWDAISGWLGRNFTTKGRFQAAADEAAPGVGVMPDNVGTGPTTPIPAMPQPQGGVPGTPVTGDGWTVGDILKHIGVAGGNPGQGVPGTPITGDGWTVGDALKLIAGGERGGGDEQSADIALPDTAPTPDSFSPNEPAPDVPQEQPMTIEEQLQQYKDFIKSVYPKQDTSDSDQQKRSDKFSEDGLKRARLMAQLALSAGITAQAGFGDVAKGLAAAGTEYDQGFKRYQDALQDSADREMSKRDLNYRGDLLQSQAAYKLMTDQQTIGREAVEKHRAENMEFLKQGKPPGELATTDPDLYKKQYDEWYRKYGQYASTGVMSPFDGDVSDSANQGQ